MTEHGLFLRRVDGNDLRDWGMGLRSVLARVSTGRDLIAPCQHHPYESSQETACVG